MVIKRKDCNLPKRLHLSNVNRSKLNINLHFTIRFGLVNSSNTYYGLKVGLH